MATISTMAGPRTAASVGSQTVPLTLSAPQLGVPLWCAITQRRPQAATLVRPLAQGLSLRAVQQFLLLLLVLWCAVPQIRHQAASPVRTLTGDLIPQAPPAGVPLLLLLQLLLCAVHQIQAPGRLAAVQAACTCWTAHARQRPPVQSVPSWWWGTRRACITSCGTRQLPPPAESASRAAKTPVMAVLGLAQQTAVQAVGWTAVSVALGNAAQMMRTAALADSPQLRRQAP